MDFFCLQEKDLVPKAIQAVRRVYSVVKMWSAPWTDVLLSIVLFFLNHGKRCKVVHSSNGCLSLSIILQ